MHSFQNIKSRCQELVVQPRFWYIFGLVVTLVASSLELFRGGAENYQVYRDATRLFFQDLSPYTSDFVASHGRYYLYSPVFFFLFAPFAFLPYYLGGFLWNIAGWTLFYGAIVRLPNAYQSKVWAIIAYQLLFVMQTVFCFQYNLLVTCIFLWAYVLLERKQDFWAILLIMVSATTKIYGIVELALLCCYPKFWRNMGYALLCGIALTLLPILHTGWEGLLDGYSAWFMMLADHQSQGLFYSLIVAEPTTGIVLPYMRYVQVGAIGVLAIAFAFCHRMWTQPEFRIGVLATLMIYIVLMSESSEFTTYTIATAGYSLWYFSRAQRTIFDKIVFWAIWVLFGVMPIDLFCPSDWCLYVHRVLWIGVWVYAMAWVRVIYSTIEPVCRAKMAVEEEKM